MEASSGEALVPVSPAPRQPANGGLESQARDPTNPPSAEAALLASTPDIQPAALFVLVNKQGAPHVG